MALVAIAARSPVEPLMSRLDAPAFVGYASAVIASIAYYTICEGIHGSTVGKIAFGLTVVADSGAPCGIRAAFVRTLGFFVDAAFFAVPAWAAMRESPVRQRLGDHWAHTRVVRRRSLRPEARNSLGRFLGALVVGGLAYSAIYAFGLLLKL